MAVNELYQSSLPRPERANTATLTIIYLMNDRSYTAQHVREISCKHWDSAVMRAVSILRQMHVDQIEIVSAILTTDDTNPADSRLSKVYQPHEWNVSKKSVPATQSHD